MYILPRFALTPITKKKTFSETCKSNDTMTRRAGRLKKEIKEKEEDGTQPRSPATEVTVLSICLSVGVRHTYPRPLCELAVDSLSGRGFPGLSISSLVTQPACHVCKVEGYTDSLVDGVKKFELYRIDTLISTSAVSCAVSACGSLIDKTNQNRKEL